jgi:hypothetical protein
MRVRVLGQRARPPVAATESSPVRLSALAAALVVLALIAPQVAEGQTLIFDRFEKEATGPTGWTQAEQGTAETPTATSTDTPTVTPTDTPTVTPTDTPTATPTRTLVPDGGSCADPGVCASGNCVDDICCFDPACPPGASCDNPGHIGMCSPDPIAPAPGLSHGGLLLVLALLIGIGGGAIQRRRRAPL